MNLHKKTGKHEGYILIEVLVAYAVFMACMLLYGHVMGGIVQIHRSLHGYVQALAEQSAQCERGRLANNPALALRPVRVAIPGTAEGCVQGVVFDE